MNFISDLAVDTLWWLHVYDTIINYRLLTHSCSLYPKAGIEWAAWMSAHYADERQKEIFLIIVSIYERKTLQMAHIFDEHEVA